MVADTSVRNMLIRLRISLCVILRVASKLQCSVARSCARTDGGEFTGLVSVGWRALEGPSAGDWPGDGTVDIEPPEVHASIPAASSAAGDPQGWRRASSRSARTGEAPAADPGRN